MFIGRKDEKKQLENAFLGEHNNLLMLYGREGIGKTALLFSFCEDKRYVYYNAVEITPAMQEKRFSVIEKEVIEGSASGKTVLIIDEFKYFSDETLNERLIHLLNNENIKIMIILVSSSVNWVENSMVIEARGIAKRLTGIMKLKDLSFREAVEWYHKLPVEDSILMRSVMGGIPKYLKLWQDNRRTRENIISIFLTRGSSLEHEAEYFLKLELRELAAYNAILIALASGKYKLNDIYAETGFSRAKISVYLKNLIEMDIVEKVNMAYVRHYDKTQKGLYRIRDSFIRFYYAYVYPNRDLIEQGRGRQIYDEKILPDMPRFVRESFAEVAREFLMILSRRGSLKAFYNDFRTWIGKTGTIDIVAGDGEGNTLAAVCFYEERMADVEEINAVKQMLISAGLRCTELFIFARAGFTDRARSLAQSEEIMTVAMADL